MRLNSMVKDAHWLKSTADCQWDKVVSLWSRKPNGNLILRQCRRVSLCRREICEKYGYTIITVLAALFVGLILILPKNFI
ncbi:MAG: hypothetical protein AB1442_06990 [Nitrospirota bacterium]